MSRKIVECVPNFSEGRDPAIVDAIARAIAGITGVAVLGRTMDVDHHRSVITFAGHPRAVLEAAVQAVGKAAELIDLRIHSGVHPRIGAADVVPFVPVKNVTLEECAALASEAGQEIWRRFGIPVYLYEAAATAPERRRLEYIRSSVAGASPPSPDFGEGLHVSAGASAVGARKFLIAWNIHLDTADVGIAKAIARSIRESSGGLKHVKALGLLLQSRGIAQVSMNLTDFEATPMHVVFEEVRRLAGEHGAGITGTEIIGLLPERALETAAEHYLRFENFDRMLVLERRLDDELPPIE